MNRALTSPPNVVTKNKKIKYKKGFGKSESCPKDMFWLTMEIQLYLLGKLTRMVMDQV